MGFEYEEIQRHRKKSQTKPPKKSNHKHIYEPCVIEYPDDWYNKPHGQNGKRRVNFYGYCPICGKVGPTDQTRWWKDIHIKVGKTLALQEAPTEEGERELNPETRTLPTFFSDDPFPKFVSFEG